MTHSLSKRSTSSAHSISPIEIGLMVALGLVGLCGLGGVMLSFVPASEPGQTNMAMTPACLGIVLAGFGGLGLTWFRRRDVSASAWLAVSIMLWMVGITFLGLGGFSMLNPGETATAQDIGFTMTLCFAPGGLLTLGGLGLYAYDRRRKRPVEAVQSIETAQPAAETPAQSLESQAGKLGRAAEYRTHIITLIDQQSSVFADQLAPIKNELNEWEAHLHELAERLHQFEANEIIQRDLREVPTIIGRLKEQLEAETNPAVAKEIEEALESYRRQQSQLEALSTLMRRTELDLDETLAAIAGIYAQLQVLSAKGIDSSKVKRLSAAVEEQANHLNDLLEAMDDVYDEKSDSFIDDDHDANAAATHR